MFLTKLNKRIFSVPTQLPINEQEKKFSYFTDFNPPPTTISTKR